MIQSLDQGKRRSGATHVKLRERKSLEASKN